MVLYEIKEKIIGKHNQLVIFSICNTSIKNGVNNSFEIIELITCTFLLIKKPKKTIKKQTSAQTIHKRKQIYI